MPLEIVRHRGGAPSFVALELPLRILGLLPSFASWRRLAVLLGQEPLLAEQGVLALVGQSPFGSAALFEAGVERPAGLGVNRIEHYVDMGVLIGMADDDGLMLAPAHMVEKILHRLDHVLAARLLARMPIQREMLRRIFEAPAARRNPGL